MNLTNVVSELEMELEESQNARDKRVEDLWKKLDPQGKKELDFKGLQRGLRRIDHRQRPITCSRRGLLINRRSLEKRR
jgi:solute carrier family 25 (mitochondrial phosphate transporter), member 23/24/25/41